MRIVLIILLVSVFAQCKDKIPPFGVEYVSVNEARAIISNEDKLQIIDVRTPEEAAEGKLEGAVVIDVRNENFESEVAKLDKEATYLVYCRSGSRSALAVEKMAELGFNRLYMMEGGYLGWQDAK